MPQFTCQPLKPDRQVTISTVDVYKSNLWAINKPTTVKIAQMGAIAQPIDWNYGPVRGRTYAFFVIKNRTVKALGDVYVTYDTMYGLFKTRSFVKTKEQALDGNTRYQQVNMSQFSTVETNINLGQIPGLK